MDICQHAGEGAGLIAPIAFPQTHVLDQAAAPVRREDIVTSFRVISRSAARNRSEYHSRLPGLAYCRATRGERAPSRLF
jgi:hypothetical protein